eukprot:8775983-Pyramimonas_sp.AAC.2
MGERPKSAHSPPAGAKAASAEEVAPGQDGNDNPLDAPGANPATQSDGGHSSQDFADIGRIPAWR